MSAALAIDTTMLEELVAGDQAGELCSYCGEEYRLEILEIWPEDRALQFDTCCEQSYADAEWEMATLWDRKDWQRFLRDEAGLEVRAVITDAQRTGQWTLDFGLTLVNPGDEGCPTRDEARAFVAAHHRHNKPPIGWRWGHAIDNGTERVAVAMVGRPVAPAIDPYITVEINRVCVDDTAEPGLVWNACSMLYGAAAREAEKRGFSKIITYTREDEDGTSLRAAGYTPEHKSKGGLWHRPNRPRPTEQGDGIPKIRWARALKPRRPNVSPRAGA